MGCEADVKPGATIERGVLYSSATCKYERVSRSLCPSGAVTSEDQYSKQILKMTTSFTTEMRNKKVNDAYRTRLQEGTSARVLLLIHCIAACLPCGVIAVLK